MQTSDEALLFQTDADAARIAARQQKASRTSNEGEPIKLASLPLDLLIRGDEAWIAENGFVARLVDLLVRRLGSSRRCSYPFCLCRAERREQFSGVTRVLCLVLHCKDC
jgi:hypothetical protein